MRNKLVREREKLGLTQKQFANAVGISRSHYSQIETGEKDPSLKVALKIKATLGTKSDDVFDKKGIFLR